MLDAFEDLDPVQRDLLDKIEKYGWAARLVMAGDSSDEPPFAYTVGMTAMGYSELVMVGLPLDTAHQFLILAADLIKEGHIFEPGTLTSALTDGDSPIAVIKVERTDGLTAVQWLYGKVDAVQLIWPDSKGNLPWQPGYNNPPEVQQFWGPLPEEWHY